MEIIINAFKIIFLLGFLIFIHEGGHFLAARLFKVKVENFSIGFGPKILSKKVKETEYSISAIPFGGYVKMTGETERSDEEGAFNNAKLLHRIAIVASGPIVNILFGLIVYFILVLCTGVFASTTVSNIIPEAVEGMANIEIGDKILEINDRKVRIKPDINRALEDSNGEELSILVLRNGEKVKVKATPIKYEDEIYILGVEVEPLNASFPEKLYYSFWKTVDFSGAIKDSLVMLVTGKVNVNQLTGPIGISTAVVETSGLYDFIYMICVISISLGLTNLLPVPALDGGRIFFFIIEGVRGKALSEEIEIKIQSLSFTLLMLLSLYVTYNDIMRLF